MALNEFRIGEHGIGESHPPFVIAEMSGNHNGSSGRSRSSTRAAAGAHALKIQTYTADTMTLGSAER